MTRPSPRSGYTLIEMLVVIGIAGALVIFAGVAMWSSVANFRFSAAVNKVLFDVRLAQQLARTHNGWYGVEFLASPTDRYHVYSTDGTTDTDVANPANLATGLNVLLRNDYGVSISAVNIDGGNKVEFNPMGTPYLDKTGSALASSGTITLATGGSVRVIQILKNTGKVELQ